jgi:hypothetical protein
MLFRDKGGTTTTTVLQLTRYRSLDQSALSAAAFIASCLLTWHSVTVTSDVIDKILGVRPPPMTALI